MKTRSLSPIWNIMTEFVLRAGLSIKSQDLNIKTFFILLPNLNYWLFDKIN